MHAFAACTSDADDGGGYVETIITNSDFTLSFEGEVRKKDKLDQYGVGKFIKYFADELKAKRQPGIWVRMDYGPVEFVGYMNITALSSDGGTNDIVTFSTEFKVGDATTIEVNELTAVAVTGVTVSPATSTGAAGGTSTFTVNIAPTGATNKDFTVATTDATKATATASGNTVTRHSAQHMERRHCAAPVALSHCDSGGTGQPAMDGQQHQTEHR
ncbi:Ig-like domain-containing protein [Enterobacter hormaechei]|uniref:Ig-like domain-containing protein n=1 Tax=Enterobacter hormaechei TaxID=158836 RepID=UPI002075237D|nr:Ig-like domain-containing protein [Enterobacter hormaechei]MCM7241527.1 Ig-like domain-containing protein [Enterobacter hormaechei]MCM7245887.1 Ig-like domain-containing protein [Enterobacter hormaechei]MCM7691384.1 Ig-like domain-containing protein [Enterobacter hormaechei]MCM7867480.1 Ig-like domain-containing protein [Enterobacter hormaechei]